MNKKIIRFLPFVATAAIVGCSGENTPADPGTGDDPLGYLSSSSDYFDPNDPLAGLSSSTTDLNQGPAAGISSSTPTTPIGMSSSQVLPGMSSSSSAKAPKSSSSGLKDYDDNHLPKESYLPKAGFYSNLTIQPLSGKQGGQVKCTFDGSFPTQNSESITAAKQITQNTVVRCSEFLNGQALDTTTQTYFINERVSMPVVALTVNHHDMFDSTYGLYATGPGPYQGDAMNATDNNNSKCQEPCKGANFWKEDELPVHVEFFENGSSTTEKNWEIDAGISIIGNYSRYKPKKSVAIKMDDDIYGDKTLKYSLFKTRPEAKKFKAFNLRNNGNRFWTDYIEDAMLTSLLEGTQVDYQRSRQVVVFYNGEYFGIHDMRERFNRGYAETNYGIDKNSINVVKNCSNGDEGYQDGWCPSGNTRPTDPEKQGASASEFAQVVNTIKNGNFDGENNQSYIQAKTKLNMSSFAQYMIAEMYIHNGDWPGNNVRFWGSPNNGQPFKAMIFDLDHGYGFTPGVITAEKNMFEHVLGSATRQTNSNNNQGNTQPGQGGNQGGMWGGNGGWDFGGMGGWGMGGASSNIGQMLNKLLNNPDFYRLFINQACILLNDYLTYDKVNAKIQEMMATIPSSDQQRDEQRWPRNQSRFTWSPSGADLRSYAQNRTQTFKQELATYFGLSGEASVSINANGKGSVYVDEMALPSSNYRGKFFSGTTMKLEAISNSGSMFTGWSDGNIENPRIVQVTEGATFTANFN